MIRIKAYTPDISKIATLIKNPEVPIDVMTCNGNLLPVMSGITMSSMKYPPHEIINNRSMRDLNIFLTAVAFLFIAE